MAFLYALKSGHYQNNKYTSKATLEIIGAMIVASFLSLMLEGLIEKNNVRIFICFGIGLCWSVIIQSIRTKITQFVDLILGSNLKIKK